MKLICILCFALIAHQAYAADSCGGLLQGTSGSLQFLSDTSRNEGPNCLWVIRLTSGSGTKFSLNVIDSYSAINLYPEHRVSESVLNPIRLNSSAVGTSIDIAGTTLIIILNQSHRSELSVTWEANGESDDFNGGAAASYVATAEGGVSWNQLGRYLSHTWALSPSGVPTLDTKATVNFPRCDLIDACQCSYFALHEVDTLGYLREVTRVCGRPAEFTAESLYSQLVAFIAVNGTQSDNYSNAKVEIKWSKADDGSPTLPPTASTTSASTTTMPSVYTGCGGLVTVALGKETVIDYKSDSLYEPNEFCIWAFTSTEKLGAIYISMERNGFDSANDGIQGYYLDPNDNTLIKECTSFNNQCTIASGAGFLTFTSDGNSVGSGFRVRVTAIPGRHRWTESSYFFDKISGNFSYPLVGDNYNNLERVMIIVQTQGQNFLEITKMAVESPYDYVHFFSLPTLASGSNTTFEARWTGSYLSGPPNSHISSSNPRLVLFTSDLSSTNTGFELKWGSE